MSTLDHSNDRKESIESIDDHINPRFTQEVDDDEEEEETEVVWVLHGIDASQFSVNAQYLITSAGHVIPAMVVDAVEKTNDLSTISNRAVQMIRKSQISIILLGSLLI